MLPYAAVLSRITLAVMMLLAWQLPVILPVSLCPACAIHAYIGTLSQNMQQVQHMQHLYTILIILFARKYCTIALHTSIAHDIAHIYVQYLCNMIQI